MDGARTAAYGPREMTHGATLASRAAHPKEVPAMYESHKQLSRRFTELFNPDGPAVEEVFGPDLVLHDGTDGELRGLDQMRAFLASYRAAFADARSTVEQQVAEGDLVVTRWRARGTHTGKFQGLAPTMRPFTLTGTTIERIEGDRIVEVWVYRDDLGLLRQLGVVPGASPASPAVAR
jgi:steroid delta-isomerase-like uncharacterized protein